MPDRKEQVWISADGEFTGRIPGPYSMISLGAVAYNQALVPIKTFKINLRELPSSMRDPDTMAWWREHPSAWRAAIENPIDAKEAMQKFAKWLRELPGQPVLMGWPLPVDFMFIYWYYEYFLGKMPPFGYSGLDIKSYAMRALEITDFRDVTRTVVREKLGIPDKEFSHDPLDDAREQGELFVGLQKYKKPAP